MIRKNKQEYQDIRYIAKLNKTHMYTIQMVNNNVVYYYITLTKRLLTTDRKAGQVGKE